MNAATGCLDNSVMGEGFGISFDDGGKCQVININYGQIITDPASHDCEVRSTLLRPLVYLCSGRMLGLELLPFNDCLFVFVCRYNAVSLVQVLEGHSCK